MPWVCRTCYYNNAEGDAYCRQCHTMKALTMDSLATRAGHGEYDPNDASAVRLASYMQNQAHGTPMMPPHGVPVYMPGPPVQSYAPPPYSAPSYAPQHQHYAPPPSYRAPPPPSYPPSYSQPSAPAYAVPAAPRVPPPPPTLSPPPHTPQVTPSPPPPNVPPPHSPLSSSLCSFDETYQRPPSQLGGWICQKCAFDNFPSRTTCKMCDAGRSQTSTQSTLKPGDWVCPLCGYDNFASRARCNRCQGPQPTVTNIPLCVVSFYFNLLFVLFRTGSEQASSTRRVRLSGSASFRNENRHLQTFIGFVIIQRRS